MVVVMAVVVVCLVVIMAFIIQVTIQAVSTIQEPITMGPIMVELSTRTESMSRPRHKPSLRHQ